jgi:hypothetical protein
MRTPASGPPTLADDAEAEADGGPHACGRAGNFVERAFCQLRQHRAVATRYDKRDFVWRGTVDVASIRIWLRHPVS